MPKTLFLITICLAAGASFSSLAVASAQSVPEMITRLHRAQLLSSLDSADMKPWHLQLAVELNDKKGKALEKGTIDEWWAGPDRYRISYIFPSYSARVVSVDGKTYRTTGQPGPTTVQEILLDQILHPLPQNAEIDRFKPDFRKVPEGKDFLQCTMLDSRLQFVTYPAVGVFPTYCFAQGSDSLVVTFDVGTGTTVRNKIGHFQSKEVAVDLTFSSGNVVTAIAHVAALSNVLRPNADLFRIEGLTPFEKAPLKIDGSVMAGRIENKVIAVYPDAAKRDHVSGQVIMRAIIGRDGQVRSLRLVNGPDSSTALSALNAVRQWTYKPYLVHGEPTEVDTTVTINFTVSGNLSAGPA